MYLLFLPRDREERLAALTALQQAQKQELQKKIQQKVCSSEFSMINILKYDLQIF